MPSRLIGPCANPKCVEREKSSGQWQFLPEGFANEHQVFNLSGQVCKKANCLRWAGLKDPPGKPGRPKRIRAGFDGDEETTSPVAEPRPPRIERIDEIWAMR